MNGIPRLSIGLPVYNGEDYVCESLDSLLGQSYEDFELIISDNASTDSTGDICRRYAKEDSRIRYIHQRQNIGLTRNHNFVFQESRGELFKWAAADDLYGRDLLRCCVEALDAHPDVVLAHAWEAGIDASGTVRQSFEYPLATDSPSAPERFRSILFGSSGLFESRDPDVRGFVRVDNRGVLRACDEYGVIRTGCHAADCPPRQLPPLRQGPRLRAGAARAFPHDAAVALLSTRLPRSDLQQGSDGAGPVRRVGSCPGEQAPQPEYPPCHGVPLGLRAVDPACAPLARENGAHAT